MRNKVIGKGSYFLLTAAIATGILAYLRFNEQAASPDVTFLKFPLQEEVFIDLDIANSVFYQQSPREQRDQILDWLLYTVVANSGLSARELTYAFYDLPIIRQGFNKNFANFSYGLIRSKAVGANNLIAVIPRLNEQNIPLSRPERIDYLAHIADEYRKNTGRIAQTIFVFEYDINLAEAFALITRQDNIKGESLFSEQQGYFTAEIRNLQSLQTFLEKTDDITYAKMQDGVLVVGGRKIQSRQYRGINDELIATLFLSEKTLRTARETMDRLGQQEWKSYSEDILSDMLVKDRTLERIAELAEENPNLFRYSNPIMRNDIRDLLSPQLNEDRYQQIIEEWRETFTKKYEKEIKELKEGSGFSLDAEYDYEALIRLLSENRSLFLGIMLDEQEFTEVIADLNRKDPSKYLRYVDEPIRAIKYLVSAQDDQYQPKYRSIKNTNPQLLKLIEDLDNCRFQYARYDGDLEGTEVGMILFYTDLLMKLWSIDFVFSSPDSTLIPDFMTDVKMGEHHSSIYSAERRELNSARSWLGINEQGFQMGDNSLFFSRITTKIFSKSSNYLTQKEETFTSAFFSGATDWWNEHYEEVAIFEQEYERLNQLMKWSVVIRWLMDHQKRDPLNFLRQYEHKIDRRNWFPDWAANHPELRFSQWDTVGFYPAGDYNNVLGDTTETLPKLGSSDGNIWGGVSLTKPDLFSVDRLTLFSNLHPIALRAKLGNTSTESEIKFLKGATYQINAVEPGKLEVTIVPKAELNGEMVPTKLRNRDAQLANHADLTFTTQFERLENGLQIHFAYDNGATEIGRLEITSDADLRIRFVEGELLKGLETVRKFTTDVRLYDQYQRLQNLEEALGAYKEVEAFIQLDEYSFLLKLKQFETWLKISPEQYNTLDVAAGWDARVAAADLRHMAINSRPVNLNIKWVSGMDLLAEGEVGEFVLQLAGGGGGDGGKIIVNDYLFAHPPEGNIPMQLKFENGALRVLGDPANKGIYYIGAKELSASLFGRDFNQLLFFLGNQPDLNGAHLTKSTGQVYQVPVPASSPNQTDLAGRSTNYTQLGRQISNDPTAYRQLVSAQLELGIKDIDLLIEKGHYVKAQYRLKTLINTYGEHESLLIRQRIVQAKSRLKKWDTPTENDVVFSIRDLKDCFQLLNQKGEVLAESIDIGELTSIMLESTKLLGKGQIAVDILDLESHRQEAFTTSLAIQNAKAAAGEREAKRAAIIPIPDGKQHLNQFLLDGEVVEGTVEWVENGVLEGWEKTIVEPVEKKAGLPNAANWLESTKQAIDNWFRVKQASEKSDPKSIIDDIELDARQQHLENPERRIILDMQDELGNSQIVMVVTEMEAFA